MRPLLPFRRRELEAWVKSAAGPGEDLPVHLDPANRDPRHDRSWLRHDLWPIAVARFGDQLADRLGDVARSAQQDRDAWAALLRVIPDLQFRTERDSITLARVPLQRYDNVLSETLLRALAREAGCMLGSERAERLLDFVRSGQSGRIMELGQGWEAELSFDRIRLLRIQVGGDPPPIECGDETEGAVSWGGWGFTWRAESAGRVARGGLETWVTPGAMSVRGVEPGDRIRPLGGVGGRKIRRLLMEERVPFRERGGFPVLVRGDQTLWVPGVCRSSTAVPRPGEAALKIVARPPRDGVEALATKQR